MNLKTKKLTQDEMPYEKCIKNGPEALSDAELLAVLLRTGTQGSSVLEVSQKVLDMNPLYDGLVGMMHFGAEEYMKINGIGKVKAIQLSVIGEIARRIWNRKKRIRYMRFTDSKQVADYYMEDLRYLDHEVVRVLYLDHQMQLIKDELLSAGTSCNSAISSREIFISALKLSASCLIVVHNHPSGDPEPSGEDIRFTKELCEAGKVIGIGLIDHVVIGDNVYFSFSEQGLISGK
ncbi:MAG: DNA repair protein RadC [Oribacterium sp.]|nr:DNA repair protein RadC [Oribacterium sp.]